MEIVIKIPDKKYEALKMLGSATIGLRLGVVEKAIINGTPLPKGHGKIVDLNDVVEAGSPLYCGDREIGFTIDFVEINDIPVLVEADKEGAKE